MNERRRSTRIALALIISATASLAATVVYALGGQPQLEGALLGIALGGLGAAAILWARLFLHVGGEVEERVPLHATTEDREVAEASLTLGIDEIGRRGFLIRLATAAAGALGLAALFPIRSLGARPGRALVETAWADGVRLVDADGRPIAVDQVQAGEVVTVFPEGHVGAADAVALLIRLTDVRPLRGREGWSQNGLVAFSKLCTHAGCPVGLYQPTVMLLFCPCHQSAFAVAEGAVAVEGPATRPLPQLPLGVDEQGNLIALGGFSAAPGPGFWWRPGDD